MMATAQYEIHDLDHLGLPARQVTVGCRHGETVRVFVRERGVRWRQDPVLLRQTTDEHEADFQCGCTRSIRRQRVGRR